MSKVPSLTVSVYKDDKLVEKKTLEKDVINVGRLGSADVRLDHPDIGVSHAYIQVAADGTVTLRDMGSSAGIWVEGAKIQEHALQPGQTATMGPFTLTFEIHGGPVAQPSQASPAAPAALAAAAAAPAAAAGATERCPNCGATNAAGSRFCNGCGAPLGEAAPAAKAEASFKAERVKPIKATDDFADLQEPVQAKAKKRKSLILAIAVGNVVVIGAVVAFLGLGDGGCTPKVKGKFEAAKGSPLGTWVWEPNTCKSGQRSGFHGVWLLRKGDDIHQIRVARGTGGETVVTVKIPGTDKAMILRKCKTLDAEIRRTNTKVNNIWLIDGSVTVDCEKEKFRGTARFENCH